MSQHLHILFTAGCWLKHLLMQMINLLVLVFVRKFKAQRRYTTQLYTVHVYVFVSQLRWMNRKAKWRQRHEIISFDASNSFVWNMSEISVAILKHSAKKWGKKHQKIMQLSMNGKSVYLSNHSSFTVKIANKSAWSIFMSWMKNQICQELVLCIIFKELKIKHESDGRWKWISSTFATSILR